MGVPDSLAEKEVKSVLISKTKGKIPQSHCVYILCGERVFLTRDRLIHFPRDWPEDAPGRRAGAAWSSKLSRDSPRRGRSSRERFCGAESSCGRAAVRGSPRRDAMMLALSLGSVRSSPSHPHEHEKGRFRRPTLCLFLLASPQ